MDEKGERKFSFRESIKNYLKVGFTPEFKKQSGIRSYIYVLSLTSMVFAGSFAWYNCKLESG
jgi:hypothetical protein